MLVGCKLVRKLLFLGQTKMHISSSQKNFDRWKKTTKKDKNNPVKKSEIPYQFMTAASAAKNPKHNL